MNRHLENYLLSLTTRNLRVELINGIKYLHREKILSTNNHHSPLLVLKLKQKASSVESQNSNEKYGICFRVMTGSN